MKYLYVLLLLFIIYSEANAQNTLSGTITSFQNSEPLLATVYIPKLEKGTIASLEGNYTIENIPQGSYTIVFSLLGYETVTEKLSFQQNEVKMLDISMNESAIEIEEVIISTPFHKLQSENVMKVERVKVSELNSKGSVTLADGITKIPGVTSISTGIGIGKPVIRGLSSNRVLTYSQGVRLENQQFGDEHGLGISDSGVESVEVIKGPASLLYGSDALGGVLYLNPERFAPNNSTTADIKSTYYSNTLGTSSNLGVKTSGEVMKFLARGAYAGHSDYKTGDELRVTNTRFNESDLKLGAQYQKQKLKSTLRYNYNRSNIGIPEEIGEQTTSKSLVEPFQEIDNHILSFENALFLKESSFNLKLGYLFNNRREFEEGESLPALQMKLNTFNYDLKYNLPDLGNFETIVGIQGMHQTNKNFGEEILIPDATTNDLGVLATTHYHLKRIDFQAGIRLDSRTIESDSARDPEAFNFINAIDKRFTSFNAAIGAKADLSEKITGRVNLASGFRAPNLAELASNGVHEGTNRYEIGNANLQNEQNLQIDVSTEFRNEHFEISINGFYNSINNYIYITPTANMIDDNRIFNYVQDNANLYGGEFGVHIHPHPLDWLHFESSFETVTGKLKDDSNLPLIPANTLRNTLSIEFKKGQKLKNPYTFIGMESVFDQNNNSSFETKTPGYTLISFGAGSDIQINKLRVNLGVNVTNLFDISYISHLSRLKQDGIANTGRSININLRAFI